MKFKVKLGLPDYKDLLRYGTIESDREWLQGHCRTKLIRYMGILYKLTMENGEVTSLMQWDNFPYQEDETDLRHMTDKELATKLMFSDRDRKDSTDAERVYWLCIMEINRRMDIEENQNNL